MIIFKQERKRLRGRESTRALGILRAYLSMALILTVVQGMEFITKKVNQDAPQSSHRDHSMP
jgi:hypothetical protein